MTSTPPGRESNNFQTHWLFRYGLAVVLFGATLGLSLLLNYINFKINLTIPIVFSLVATAWYGGRGPGLLISILFEGTTILYTPIPPDSSVGRAIFGYFSVFSLYVFLALLISGLRKIQYRLKEQRDLLQITLSSIGDAVIAADNNGAVTFMNPVAEELTGWQQSSARGVPLEKVFRVVHEETRDEVTNPVAKVFETGSLVGMANHSVLISKSGKEFPIDDSAAPIMDKGKIRGVVLVFSDVTTRKMAERARRESEMMHRLVEAQEAERSRIARDLHDHLGQKMTGLRLRTEMLDDKTLNDGKRGEAINEVQTLAADIDRDIGFLSWELRPTELENLGLADALKSFVREWSKQYGIVADFQANLGENENLDTRLSHTVETNLYRIVQEGLNNVLKHAAAKNVSVLLQYRKTDVVLIIEDDGKGFDREVESLSGPEPGRLGMVVMQERAALLGGTLEIDSHPGGGTTIFARIPITQLS
jgi:PAS domain S-box-containing protein